MPSIGDFRTRRLADEAALFDDSIEANEALAPPPVVAAPERPVVETVSIAADIVRPCLPPASAAWESGLFRLATSMETGSCERAYACLSSAVRHFENERLERIGLERLRAAVGVLVHVRVWAAANPFSVTTSHALDRLANGFDAWHHYRELLRAVDIRHDLAARMRGRSDELILNGLFTAEGREIVASHARGFRDACVRLDIATSALRRSGYIARVLTYQREPDVWQASAAECLGLCTDLVRELGDATTHEALRDAVHAAWCGLSLETKRFREVYRSANGDDVAALVAEIDERFEALMSPGTAAVVYFPSERRARPRVTTDLAQARPGRRFVF